MKGCAVPRAFATVILLMMVSIAGLAEAQEADPCAGVDCSGHGICIPFEGVAACNCDPGFVPDATNRQCITEGGEAPAPQPEQPPELPPEPPTVEVEELPPTEPAPPAGVPDADPTQENPQSDEGVLSDPHVPDEQLPVDPNVVEEPPVEPPPVEPLPVEEPPVVEPPPVVPMVPVTFDVRRGRQRIEIRVGDERHECLTPCTLDLPPGDVQIGPPSGSWESDVSFTVPGGPAVARILRDRGRRLRGAGIGLAAGGGGLAAIGLIVAVLASPAISNLGFEGGDAAGLAIAIPGTLAFVAGLVLLAIAPESYRVQLEASSQPPPESPQTTARRRTRFSTHGLAPAFDGSATHF